MPADNLWPTEEEEKALDRVNDEIGAQLRTGKIRGASLKELERAAAESRAHTEALDAYERSQGRPPLRS